jgi:hypothetical protein
VTERQAMASLNQTTQSVEKRHFYGGPWERAHRNHAKQFDGCAVQA